MTEKLYFVMIRDQHGGAIVMVDGDVDDVNPPPKFFETTEKAAAAAKQNLLARACGFEVFHLDHSELSG